MLSRPDVDFYGGQLMIHPLPFAQGDRATPIKLQLGDAILYSAPDIACRTDEISDGLRQICLVKLQLCSPAEQSIVPPITKSLIVAPIMSMPNESSSLSLPFTATFINLDTRPDRRWSMACQLRRAKMHAVHMRAITGKQVSSQIVTGTWDSSLNSLYDLKTLPALLKMSDGERGCAASHALLWGVVSRWPDSHQPLLILEDDVVLCDNFKHRCAELIRAVESHVEPKLRTLVLYVGGEVAKWRSEPGTFLRYGYGARQLLREAEYIWQTSSYLLYPAAARNLLAAMPIDAPVDCFMSRQVLSNRVRALVAVPALAWQGDAYHNGNIVHTNVYKPPRVNKPPNDLPNSSGVAFKIGPPGELAHC